MNHQIVMMLMCGSLSLTGCMGLPSVKDAVDKGAAASDDAREAAEFVLCRGITVGAWVRSYGDNPDKAEAWRTLCSTQAKKPASPAK